MNLCWLFIMYFEKTIIKYIPNRQSLKRGRLATDAEIQLKWLKSHLVVPPEQVWNPSGFHETLMKFHESLSRFMICCWKCMNVWWKIMMSDENAWFSDFFMTNPENKHFFDFLAKLRPLRAHVQKCIVKPIESNGNLR